MALSAYCGVNLVRLLVITVIGLYFVPIMLLLYVINCLTNTVQIFNLDAESVIELTCLFVMLGCFVCMSVCVCMCVSSCDFSCIYFVPVF